MTGITREKGKWKASYHAWNKRIHLGLWNTQKEAVAARYGAIKLIEKATDPAFVSDAAAKDHLGAFKYVKHGSLEIDTDPTQKRLYVKVMDSVTDISRITVKVLRNKYREVRSAKN